MSIVVGLAKCKIASYPQLAPFSPSCAFPEMMFLPPQSLNQREENHVYAAVRQSLYLAGLDVEHFGSERWNPLGVYIRPGDRILIKPNFVLHEYNKTVKDCLITHGAIVRAVLDYVFLAGGSTCRITIADAPEVEANFERILKQTDMLAIVNFYREVLNFRLEFHDLRTVATVWDGENGFFSSFMKLPGDPLGYAAVNLGLDSELEPVSCGTTDFAIADYDLGALRAHHRQGKHEYLIARTALESDVVISLPKMKTHQKAGLTGGLKNLVGINGAKDWLPHYRKGSPRTGGDEHLPSDWLVGVNGSTKNMLQRRSRFLWQFMRTGWRLLRRFAPKSAQLASGAWYGNDTTWRMVLDLNKILAYANREGQWSSQKQRQFFCIVDGVIAGQGNGPLSPTANAAGVVLAGSDAAAIDVAMAQLMGYDWRKLPLLARFLQPSGNYWFTKFNGQGVCVATNEGTIALDDLTPIGFTPPPGWIGHIEKDEREKKG